MTMSLYWLMGMDWRCSECLQVLLDDLRRGHRLTQRPRGAHKGGSSRVVDLVKEFGVSMKSRKGTPSIRLLFKLYGRMLAHLLIPSSTASSLSL
jgi:hypothetical protein